jgi:outer membrane protein OmpU
MKKVLLTTSALTLLAGAAAADVSIGGYGRLGVSNTGSKTSNYARNSITFSASAATDNGLTLGTWTRYQSDTGSTAATGVFAGPKVTISNGAMTLSAGNTGGAISNTAGVFGCGAVMWGCADMPNALGWASTSSGGTGPNVVRLDMALGAASVSISGGNGNDTEAAISLPMAGGSLGVGFDQGHAATSAVAAAVDSVSNNVYTPGKAAVAAGAKQDQEIHLNYSGSMNGMGVGVRMSQGGGKTGYMGTLSAPVSAGSVYVFAGKDMAGANKYGLRYNQSLGGGASMHAGVTSNASATTVGAGIHFGF